MEISNTFSVIVSAWKLITELTKHVKLIIFLIVIFFVAFKNIFIYYRFDDENDLEREQTFSPYLWGFSEDGNYDSQMS